MLHEYCDDTLFIFEAPCGENIYTIFGRNLSYDVEAMPQAFISSQIRNKSKFLELFKSKLLYQDWNEFETGY